MKSNDNGNVNENVNLSTAVNDIEDEPSCCDGQFAHIGTSLFFIKYFTLTLAIQGTVVSAIISVAFDVHVDTAIMPIP